MEELDFYREELDGRNQCESELDRFGYDGVYPRCKLEKHHALDHAGDGFIWTDEQQRKVVEPMSRWLVNLVRLLGLAVMLTVYGLLRAYFTHEAQVEVWFLIFSLAVLVAIFICCAGVILGDIKRKVQKEYRG